VIYVYLAGNAKPDFGTLCIFRREHKKLIEDVSKKIVLIAKVAGILHLGHLATDETKDECDWRCDNLKQYIHHYIAKPFDIQQLVNTVKRYFTTSQ
jgi:hypothetical protein